MLVRPHFVFLLDGHVGLVDAQLVMCGATKQNAVRIDLAGLNGAGLLDTERNRRGLHRACETAAWSLMHRLGVRLVKWRMVLATADEAVRRVFVKEPGPVPALDVLGCALHDDCLESDALAAECYQARRSW
jgi:hypothetical protein